VTNTDEQEATHTRHALESSVFSVHLKILSKYKGRFSIKTLSTQENTDTDKTTSLSECTTPV